MLALRIIFISLTIASLLCLFIGARYKRRNVGFILADAILTVCNIVCFALIGVHNAGGASKVLLPYYILHCWMLFAVVLMIVSIDKYRNFIISIILAAIVCLYQTYLVVSQYFGARIFSFQKRIYFRRAWFVATDTKFTGLFFSYRSYRIMIYINMLISLVVIAICISYSSRIFRIRYISLVMIMIAFAIVEGLTVHFALPIWIPCLAYNIMNVICLYLTVFFARGRLREWSLDSFANDMSDGLILYDKYDDLIHINDMIRETLSEDLVEGFADRKRLESWISDTGNVENNTEIITYNVGARVYYFKITIREIMEHGNRIGTLFILHDTTDSITRIRAMQKANEELERANQMKSDFLANMSHEIRTPMNAVIGMTEIAMREEKSPEVMDYLSQIRHSGNHLLSIINDVLDYSKIEAGKMEIVEEEYVPFEELDGMANLLVTRIGDKKLDLFFTVSTGMPHRLMGDAARIRQVLINLANNAIKFTAEGSVKVSIAFEPASEGIVNMEVHVVDTGIGIREEDLNKLFVSFQQVDSKRNRSVEGTGLGLAISQKLVEAMGGEIGVNSEYGSGSDFWFRIPLRVIEDTNDLAVENPSDKRAFVYTSEEMMADVFEAELRNLGVAGGRLASLDSYLPDGRQDYLFYEFGNNDPGIGELLDRNPDLTGIVLTDFDSDYVPDKPNLHIMHRPETTMTMVRILNGEYLDKSAVEEDKTFRIDFTAPDARFLVVDDNHINLTIAEGLLAPLKVRIDTADGGQQAIDKVAANDYDIVFMDHMMPEIDGVDATRTIRAAGDRADKPVIIALSANAMTEARSLFIEAGMNDFVPKPIDVKDLITKVKKWLPEDKIIENDGTEAEISTDPGTDENWIRCEGLDTEAAVRALGSTVLYDKIASEYYRSGEDKYNGIMNAYANEDWTDYTIRVHALKSSSRQIGAMELGSMAEALEKAGKADDYDTIRANNAAAMEVFQKLLDDLSAYYGAEEDDSDKPRIERDTLNGLLDELMSACDDLDMDGMESVSDSLKGYSYDEDMKPFIDDLQKAISDMDTDVCAELAEKLR